MVQNMNKLFSELTKGKKLIMSCFSLMILLGIVGFGAYELTKTSVTLVIDGEESILKTHSKTVEDLMIASGVLVDEHDYIEPTLETELENGMNIVWIPAIFVTVMKDGKKLPTWTTSNTVSELVSELQLDVSDHDVLTPGLEAELVDGMNVTFESAFSVLLKSDGEEKEVYTTSTTVADFLEKEEIVLGELDRVEPAQGEIIEKNSEVRVIRVEKVTDVVEESTDFATVTRNDSSMAKGAEKVIQAGQKGKIAKHYEVIIENGKEVSRTLVKTETLAKSTEKVVAVGTRQPTPTVSRSSSPAPTSTKAASDWMTFQATAYTANCTGCSGITATGVNLKSNPSARVIAVDPSVIPLGSKVEVRGLGVYTAADTGGAVRGRKIDIFMANRSDALSWGRRSVQIRLVK